MVKVKADSVFSTAKNASNHTSIYNHTLDLNYIFKMLQNFFFYYRKIIVTNPWSSDY